MVSNNLEIYLLFCFVSFFVLTFLNLDCYVNLMQEIFFKQLINIQNERIPLMTFFFLKYKTCLTEIDLPKLCLRQGRKELMLMDVWEYGSEKRINYSVVG